MLVLLGPGGLRRPYRVCTMDETWWEAAAYLNLPRYFFHDKLRMMRFCLRYGSPQQVTICLVEDGRNETISMAASFYAMGAIEIPVHPS